jgi:hypothetical protein
MIETLVPGTPRNASAARSIVHPRVDAPSTAMMRSPVTIPASSAGPPGSGLTLVPLQLYFRDGRAKVEIALARGKKTYDKRQDLAARDAAREVAKVLGRRAKGH